MLWECLWVGSHFSCGQGKVERDRETQRETEREYETQPITDIEFLLSIQIEYDNKCFCPCVYVCLPFLTTGS